MDLIFHWNFTLPGEDGAWAWFDPLPVHACCASLRALRLGCVQLSTKLLVTWLML